MTDLWEYLRQAEKPIVLYGTGDGADKILDVMEKKGIKASGVFASDGFVRKRVFRSFPVLSYKEACERFGDMIILICFGSSLPDVMERFFSLSALHETYVPDVPVVGGELFDLDFLNKNSEKINRVRSLLASESSLKLYDSIIMAKLTGKIEYFTQGVEDDSDILDFMSLKNAKVALDLGAYNGDTALKLFDHVSGIQKIIAVEPDERNFKKLCINTSFTSKIVPIYAAASDKKEVLTFTKGGGRGIRRKEGGKTVSVMGVPAQTLLEGEKADYIKIDVEGNEKQAIMGVKNEIISSLPTLRIALYHRSEDIFELPLMINELSSQYKLYIKRTMSFPMWDIDLIAKKD